MARTTFQRYIDGKRAVLGYEVTTSTPVPFAKRDESTEELVRLAKPHAGNGVVGKIQSQLQTELNRLRLVGAREEVVHEQLQAGVRAAASKYGEHVKAEVGQATEALEGLRKAWKRDRYDNAARTSVLQTELKAKVDAMTDKEVEQRAEEYVGKPNGTDPLEVDLLLGRLKSSPVHEVLRKAAEDNGASLPWLHTAEAAPHVETVARYASLRPGEVVLDFGDGKAVNVSIASLVDLGSKLEDPPVRTDFQL